VVKIKYGTAILFLHNSRVKLIKTVCAIMHTFYVAKLKQYTQRQTVKH